MKIRNSRKLNILIFYNSWKRKGISTLKLEKVELLILEEQIILDLNYIMYKK